MEEEKRIVMFTSFHAGRSPKEVIEFFNYPKFTNDAHRKKRSRSLGATRTDEFVTEVKRKVNEDGNKSYAKLAAEMGCSKQTIANTINKDLGYSSYKKRHRMILTEGTRESRRVEAEALLNNLKHETAGLLRFFFDENFFSQDQNSNTKFHSSVMVLGVISSEGDVMPYHWSPGLWPPSSPDCNPIDYFWGMVENKTNKPTQNTLDSLRAAIVEEFANMKKDVVAKAQPRDGRRR
ncbi:Uncharacterized protein FKW44_006706 [Caligus rogercresseyi]|uniref:Tc1-like transposase DDE domain-containing protein n=1 Tax=Caligus rogercresseyi TaxID=217165 RepID=A0A7T8QT08_CALRO|nr:Uncharacterized protein FKW44_006706 [Caligus rogercresseyi]